MLIVKRSRPNQDSKHTSMLMLSVPDGFEAEF